MMLSLSKYKLSVFFFSLGLYLLVPPLFSWPILNLSYLLAMMLILTPFLMGFSHYNKYHLLVFFLFLFIKIYEGASYLGAGYYVLIISLITSFNDCFIKDSFYFFKKVVVFFIVPGLCLWIFHNLIGFDFLLLGFMPDNYVLNPLKVENGTRYVVYPFSTALSYHGVVGFYRFQSFFDEPGYLGTIIALILAANGCSFKGKVNKLLMISGLFTFSLAFYIIFSISFFLNHIRSFYKFIKYSLFFLLCLAGLISTDFGYKLIENKIINRISIQDGWIKGDNRSTEYVDERFEYFIYEAPASVKFFGVDDFENNGAAGFKSFMVQNGFLGLVLFFLFFCLLFFSYKKKASSVHFSSFLPFLFVFVCSFFQRPDVMSPLYIYIFVSGVVLSRYTREGVIKSTT